MAAPRLREPTEGSTGSGGLPDGNRAARPQDLGVDQIALGDLVGDLVQPVEAEVWQRHEHRRGQARIEALQRDLAAVGEAHSVLVQTALKAGHHDLFGRADAQRLLQGFVDAFETEMGIGRDARCGVAAGAGGEAHRAGAEAHQLVGLTDGGGDGTIQFEGIVTHSYRPSRGWTARLTEWGSRTAYRTTPRIGFSFLKLACGRGLGAGLPGWSHGGLGSVRNGQVA